MENAPALWLLAAIAAVGLWVVLVRPWLQGRRRRRLRSRPLPPEWVRWLDRHHALYRKVPSALRERLHGQIQVLLAEKRFEGAGGMEVDDRVRLAIAFPAALLMLNDWNDAFPRLYTVLVYPAPFVSELAVDMGMGTAVQTEEVRLGESWDRGNVVLSWDDVEADLAPGGGNVVLHEFAHQADQAYDLSLAGDIPDPADHPDPWVRAFGDAYRRLVAAADAGRHSFLDPYGAEDPAECFAVATEAFFITPVRFRKAEPDLYAELVRLWAVDPAAWGRG